MMKFIQSILVSACCIGTVGHAAEIPNFFTESEWIQFNRAIHLVETQYIVPIAHPSLFQNVMTSMLNHLDPHSNYLSADSYRDLKDSVSGHFFGIGVELSMRHDLLTIIGILPNSPAEKAHVQTGDVITRINNHSLTHVTLEEAVHFIRNDPGSVVSLNVVRPSWMTPRTIHIQRNAVDLITVKGKLLQKNYGYIRIGFFQDSTAAEFRNALRILEQENQKSLYGLILDLRNNPGGVLESAIQVADDLIDTHKTTHQYHDALVYTRGRTSESNTRMTATPGERIPHTALIVLLNEESASASEIVAGALQDYKRAIILGTRSFGKGSIQTVFPLDAQGNAIKLTTALYYTPSGRNIQEQGIVPDVIVPRMQARQVQKSTEYSGESHLNHAFFKTTHSEEHIPKLAEEDYLLYQAWMILKIIAR